MNSILKIVLLISINSCAHFGISQIACDETHFNFLSYFGTTKSENPCAINQIGTDGYIISGTKEVSGISIGFLIRINLCGEILWQNYYKANEVGKCVSAVKVGNDILLNFNNDWKTAMVKIDIDGNIISSKQFGSAQTYPRNMIRSNDGNLLFVGVSNASGGFGSNDVYLVKTNIDGTIIWAKRFGKYANEFGHNVMQDANDNIIVVGYTRDYSGSLRTGLIFKFSPTGDMIWNKEYQNGGGQTYLDYCTNLGDAYYFSGANNHSGHGQEDILVTKTDLNGMIIWSKLIGTNGYDQGLSIHAYDNYIYLFGLAKSEDKGVENILLKLDSDGNIIDQITFGSESDELIFFRAAKNFDINSDGFYGCSISENGSIGSRDMLVFHFENFDQFCETSHVDIQIKNADIFGNPFNATVSNANWTTTNVTFQNSSIQPKMIKSTVCSIVNTIRKFDTVNIFSPNEDGSNDLFTFQYKTDSISTFQCIIVDRWGVEMYQMNSISDGWNGTNKTGDQCPDGTFFYIYQATADDGTIYEGQGTVQLAR